MQPMPEIAEYVKRGGAAITPRVVAAIVRQIPLWKAEFTQIKSPSHPHLVDQLQFLADAVEDVMEGSDKDLAFEAFAEAVFALTYAHKKVDIIPDFVLHLGHADDSSVVRAVLIQNERAFAQYASRHNINWAKITSQP
jgi:uncharacterized membrane protein YkvA (DUF1232 family)